MTNYQSESFSATLKDRTPVLRTRLTLWRKQPTVVRIIKPSNISTARRLGYKAVNGVVVARVRLSKGRRVRDRPTIGRKPGRNQKRVSPAEPQGSIAVAKAAKRFPNLKGTKAYFVGQDGEYAYFEVILTKR